MPPRRRKATDKPTTPTVRPDLKDCPKGPHSKEEWVDGCEWDFCYTCIHWHYLFPKKVRKTRKKS